VSDADPILVESDGPVTTVTFNRPQRMNGITNLMARELHTALRTISTDPGVSVLVLTGAGRGFCPGADLFGVADDEDELHAEYFQAATLLHDMPAVTIAAINGACAGAGLGWAASCDLRYAAEAANFTTAFLGVAVAGDMGLPWTLPRIVGAARARELSFFPGKFSAAEARADGLVTDVFDDDSFRARVAERVARLAASSPAALRTLKANYVAAERMAYADFIELETSRHLQLLGSPDFDARVRDFTERARP
jgi:2-(1,2-epoxy-1,2-dihydrophenyl)acetyl-CoA isomerase